MVNEHRRRFPKGVSKMFTLQHIVPGVFRKMLHPHGFALKFQHLCPLNDQTFSGSLEHIHFEHLVYSANLRFYLCKKPLDFLLDNKEAFTLQPGHWLSCPPDRTCSSATDQLMLLGRWMGDVPHSLVCQFHCFPPVTKDTCESLFSRFFF